MGSTSAEVRAALVASTYYILLVLDDTEEVSSHIRILSETGISAIANKSRPKVTFGSDYPSLPVIWDGLAHNELDLQSTMKDECRIAIREDVNRVMNQIQDSAQQRDGPVARAVAALARVSRDIHSESY
jgi:hypothetical protein